MKIRYQHTGALFAALCLSVLPSHAQCIKSDPLIEAQIEDILSRMTLEEKVGQMCELTYDVVALHSEPVSVRDADKATASLAGGLLSAGAVDRVFGEYKVGSILNVPEDIAQTPEVWADVIGTLNRTSEFQAGIPQIYGVDQIHGTTYSYGGTLFPHEIGQGASFNVEIPHRIGEITAYESRACLIPWVYSPVMDLARTPLWSRVYESFGEDVLVNSLMATELNNLGHSLLM